MGENILDQYNHYLSRLDKAFKYNDEVAVIQENSKEYHALIDIING